MGAVKDRHLFVPPLWTETATVRIVCRVLAAGLGCAAVLGGCAYVGFAAGSVYIFLEGYLK